jgi:hypothetical protein
VVVHLGVDPLDLLAVDQLLLETQGIANKGNKLNLNPLILLKALPLFNLLEEA